MVRRRLSEIRLVQLLGLKQISYDTERGSVTLAQDGTTIRTDPLYARTRITPREGTYGCSQTSGVTNRQQVQPLPRPAALFHSLNDPISTPFSHSFVLPDVDLMHGAPRLDHVLGDLLYWRVGIDTSVQDLSDPVEGGTQVDCGRSGEEEMVEERLDVVAQLDRRSQETWPRTLR